MCIRDRYNFKGGSKRYGIPYKGSKNKVVKWLVECLPSSENFYDLFCGGCAVTHYAILQHRWRNFHINDINPMLAPMFVDAINGKFKNENRWISREDFHRLKAIDPYVSICFSFGNDMNSYAYGEDKEELKKAIHYACLLYTSDAADDLLCVDFWGRRIIKKKKKVRKKNNKKKKTKYQQHR